MVEMPLVGWLLLFVYYIYTNILIVVIITR